MREKRRGEADRTQSAHAHAHGRRARRTGDERRQTEDGGRKGARRVARGLGFMPFRAKILDITPDSDAL